MVRSVWQAADGATSPLLRECLTAAVAAPSIHNTQPWLFRPRGDRVDVLVDRSRQLPILDPHGREMFVSVGAAIFNLRVALRARGWQAQTRLMPDPAEPDVAARVVVVSSAAPSPTANALADAIYQRHTNRFPFTDERVPYGTLEEFAGAASAEGAALLVADPALRNGVLGLTRTAENRMRTDSRYRAEVAYWTTPPGVARPDGVPLQALGPRDAREALPLRDLAVRQQGRVPVVAFEPEPTIVLVFTAEDTPVDWLRAGAAMEKILLTATHAGLAATPLTQLTEIPALRRLLADTFTGQVVQNVLRVGYATAPASPTPRRALTDVLLTPSDRATPA
jgi:nitroreductase